MCDNGAPAPAPFILGSVAVPSSPPCTQFDAMDCVEIRVGSGCESADGLTCTPVIRCPKKGGLSRYLHKPYSHGGSYEFMTSRKLADIEYLMA